jgi:hypothetical protein
VAALAEENKDVKAALSAAILLAPASRVDRMDSSVLK